MCLYVHIQRNKLAEHEVSTKVAWSSASHSFFSGPSSLFTFWLVLEDWRPFLSSVNAFFLGGLRRYNAQDIVNNFILINTVVVKKELCMCTRMEGYLENSFQWKLKRVLRYYRAKWTWQELCGRTVYAVQGTVIGNDISKMIVCKSSFGNIFHMCGMENCFWCVTLFHSLAFCMLCRAYCKEYLKLNQSQKFSAKVLFIII